MTAADDDYDCGDDNDVYSVVGKSEREIGLATPASAADLGTCDSRTPVTLCALYVDKKKIKKKSNKRGKFLIKTVSKIQFSGFVARKPLRKTS